MRASLAAFVIFLFPTAGVTSFTPPQLSFVHGNKCGPLFAGPSINGEGGSGKRRMSQVTEDVIGQQDYSNDSQDYATFRAVTNGRNHVPGEAPVALNGDTKEGSDSEDHKEMGKLVGDVSDDSGRAKSASKHLVVDGTITNDNDSRIRKVAPAEVNGKSKEEAFPVFSAFFASPVKKSPDTVNGEKANGQVAPTDDQAGTDDGLNDEPNQKDTAIPDSKPVTLDEDDDGDHIGSAEANVEVDIVDADSDLNVTLSDVDEVNGANSYDEEERIRRFNEYKKTSMSQLRENLKEAKQEAMKAKERVTVMQQRVDELQKELDFAEDEYQHYLAIKEEESDSIAARVDELEGLIQAKQDRKRQAEESVQAAGKAIRDKLQKELEDVKFALRQAKEELNDEKEASAQIQARLEQAEEQAKMEKSAFDRDEESMIVEIEAKRSKVADAEIRIQRQTDLFEEERISMGKMLQELITRLAETNARKQREQAIFGVKQLEVQRSIEEINEKLKATEEAIHSERKRSVEVMENLETLAEDLKRQLREATDKLESEKRESQQAREHLEMKLVFDKVKANILADEVKSQQELHRREMKSLETTSAQNRAELEKAEALLESTRARYLREENSLKEQIEDSKRVRKLKAKQMSQRYRDIREDMTSRWQSERRTARQEQRELIAKYTVELSSLEDVVPGLEREVTEARQLTENLRIHTDEVMRERDVLLGEGRQSELRYLQKKQERNIAISALENEIDDLKGVIAERDEKLVTYKSSLRALLGLSVNLTKQRVAAARKRLLSRFRKRKKRVRRKRSSATGLLNTETPSIDLDDYHKS